MTAQRWAGPQALHDHLVLWAGANLGMVAVWGLTASTVFWPVHAFLPLTALLIFHAWVVALRTRPTLVAWSGGSVPLGVHVGASAVQCLYFVALWIEGGGGLFWPGWAILGLTAAAGVHAALVGRRG